MSFKEETAYAHVFSLITTMNPFVSILPFPSDIQHEYMKFLVLKCKYDDYDTPFILSPSGVIDQIWHTHILKTKNYSDMCFKAFGKFFHHDPDSIHYKKEERYERTLNAYRDVFREDPPRHIWHSTEEMLKKEKETEEKKAKHKVEVNNAVEKYYKEKNDKDVKNIFIKSLSGKNTIFNFHLDANIGYIKKVYEAIEGIPACQLRLLWAGKELDEELTLNDYEIKNEATLHILMRLIGC